MTDATGQARDSNIGHFGPGAFGAEAIKILRMAIYMGAGLSVMYANHALAAFGQFKSQQGEPSVGAG